MNLTDKSEAIKATIATIRETRAKQNELLDKLERIAGLYAVGIDPANIVTYVASHGAKATVKLRDGSTHNVDAALLYPPKKSG